MKTEFEPLTKLMKKVFGEKVEKVLVSSRFADSLCPLRSQTKPSEFDLVAV